MTEQELREIAATVIDELASQNGTLPSHQRDKAIELILAALQSVHAKAVEQTWKNAHKLAFNWATWEGEYETDTKTVLANLAGRNAPPINQQAHAAGRIEGPEEAISLVLNACPRCKGKGLDPTTNGIYACSACFEPREAIRARIQELKK